MTHSTKPPRTLRSRQVATAVAESERPRLPAAFANCPESRRIMEEMIFNDRFAEEYADKTVMVGVNEVSAIRFGNPLPCVGTSSLSSCVGIAAYDAEMRVAAVAHVMLGTAGPDLEHVGKMIARVIEAANAVGGRKFVLYSFNGRNGTRDRNDQLADFLDAQAGSLISSGIVSQFEQREEHNFVLDTRSGSIFSVNIERLG